MDLYKVLGVSRHATQDDVKKAFRKLALECHPDRNAGRSKAASEQAEQLFRAVSEAYEVLGNESKRDLYNKGQASRYSRSGSAASSTGQQYYRAPKARSGWANYRYQQQQRPTSISANLAAFLRGMTKSDGYFHLLMGGALVGGILFMGTAGEAMWASINKGKLFKDLPQNDTACKKAVSQKAELSENASQSAEAEQVQVLVDLLTGLSGHSGAPVHQRELTIRSQVSPFTELKLVQQISEGEADGHKGWEICHDGIPVKGKGYTELPALVRKRTVAALHGRHSLSFWENLGFSVIYELLSQGFSYHVYHDGSELQVMLCSVAPAASSLQQCEAHIQGVCQKYWLVNITAAVPEAQAMQTAHAIGSFSKLLEPIVALRKE